MTIEPAYGEKSHENCNLCHKDVSGENYKLLVDTNSKAINPSTDKAYGRIDSLCVSCHDLKSKTSHPVGVIPTGEVDVPTEALGFPGQEDKISCLSCHNPHPENANYKYLRWPPENQYNLAQFCLSCHINKGIKQSVITMR